MNYLVHKLIDRVNYYNYKNFKGRVLNVNRNYEDVVDNGFFSQEGQDLYINNLLDKKSGYFIDIGATDGIYINNSYYFEKNGWREYKKHSVIKAQRYC